ncbi:probable sulfatase [Oceanicola granulosus HTCC2516]|uniref:Probable sulfatase n=1 Tax=Oceanicola granulosus (strain ATCC BAA-861 / DSM 15982 / KCTC 12143 / HTCC2516) TaxID=314256 RepID=Q2CEJ3_OCEGH|nr:sulfatase-like hydrolase/transferase [Oceanicola granulosus]EAR51139.1 probable sulfatase [Oceanicola granulosus HTCC2516]
MAKRPNILLITTDQHHYEALGAVNDKLSTPNLDRLCNMGTRYERAYCPNPVCTPSRASIITGQYPSHHGAWTIGVDLDEDRPFLGDWLAGAGYRTGLVGKAHFTSLAAPSLESQPTLRDLDFWGGFNGPWYGFQHIELARNHADESHVGQHYARWLEDKGLADWREYFQPLPGETAAHAPEEHACGHYWAREGRSWALPDELHYTRWTGERSAAFIEAGEGPFFLWASFHDPHPPYTVPEPWASMYDPADMEPGRLVPGEHDANPPHFAATQQEAPDFASWHRPHEAHGCESHLYPEEELKKDLAVYYGMISFIDAEVGRLLDLLEARGELDDTLIVFTTDHGHFLGQHGLVAKGPFHYEDLIRIPFIVAWPGEVPAGAVSDALQSLVDLAPSFLEAAGAEVPGSVQGRSQLATWRGGAAVRSHAICENRHNPVMPHLATYVERDAKITVYREGEMGELFDLAADPGELRNLWDAPEAAGLKARMLQGFVQARLAAEPTPAPRRAGA